MELVRSVARLGSDGTSVVMDAARALWPADSLTPCSRLIARWRHLHLPAAMGARPMYRTSTCYP